MYLFFFLKHPTYISIDENFCGTANNVGVVARYPLDADTNFTNDKYMVSSLAIVTVHEKTIAIFGTQSGHLLKVYFYIIEHWSIHFLFLQT